MGEDSKENVVDAPSAVVNENVLVGRELEWAINTEERLQEHKSLNGPIVRTRFPPEPNGMCNIEK